MTDSRIVKELEEIVGFGNVYTKLSERIPYRFGNLVDFHIKPPDFLADFIVKPKSTQEVSKIIKLANKEKIPVTPWGGGTDLTGANSPIDGGIVLDMKGLNNINVDKHGHYITAGGGTILIDLTIESEKHNFLFPHELVTQASATVGGCIATNSFGHRSGRYRSINNLLLAIEFVSPTGEVIKTKPLFRNAIGYDLASLMTGSEGTLGVITEATFMLLPQPKTREFVFYMFDSLENGINAAKELNQDFTPEYFDLMELSLLRYSKTKVDLLKRYLKSKTLEDYIHSKYVESSLYGSILERIIETVPLTRQITKHIEATMKGNGCLSMMSIGFEGTNEVVKTKVRMLDGIARKHGGLKFEDQTYYEKRFGGILEHTREVLIHVNEANMDENSLSTLDVTIPIPNVIKLSGMIHTLVKKYKNIQLIDIDLYSHMTTIGMDLLVRIDKQKEYEEFMRELKSEISKLGGSLSFAHGAGIRFMRDMDVVHDKTYLEMMWNIKKSVDPNNIMNPNKIGRSI